MQYGVSQEQLAEKVGISKRHLIRIENGTQALAEKMETAIKSALEELWVLKSDCRLDVMIDYVRIHFMTKDVRRVVEEALRFPFADMIREERGFYGFDATY